MRLANWVGSRPIIFLTLLFLTWKALILVIVLLSPGIGYDSCTSILQQGSIGAGGLVVDTPSETESRLWNLVRWDAIYHSQLAQRGHVFEQEWAFGIGLSTTTSYLTHLIPGLHDLRDFVVVGVITSHVAHWLSVILLWSIAHMSIRSSAQQRDTLAFVAAALHIVSPAGVFLSAPYAESLFACLSMLGFYLYIRAGQNGADLKLGITKLLAGIVFGCATMVRSNGVLNGLPFLLDAIGYSKDILDPRLTASTKVNALLKLLFTILGGSCIAVGMIVPQFIAYQDYCTEGDSLRPWCDSMLPSIFTWVQSHYWNVGLLRYWTLSNVPLFMLATPILYILTRSGLDGCKPLLGLTSPQPLDPNLSARLALPQLVLAVLAFTSYHVQIITRLSSGCPFWYIWLAVKLDDWKYSDTCVRIMVLYGLIQAGLYASFLPPA